jgi:hypothetical protein
MGASHAAAAIGDRPYRRSELGKFGRVLPHYQPDNPFPVFWAAVRALPHVVIDLGEIETLHAGRFLYSARHGRLVGG